jgi:hypothetical protein
MGGRAFTRWQAAGIHLGICVAIAASVVTLMLALWYPRPLFEGVGGLDLLFIVLAVDVSAGPMLTLIVFKSGKPGMKFDLLVIGLLQASALAYGVNVVALARPAFVVFVKDRFEMVTVAELAAEELAAARYPEFRAPPWGGPMLVASDMPTDPAESQKLVQAAAAGLDVQHFPRHFEPYAKRAQEVLASAVTVARFREAEPETAKAVDAWLAESGTREAAVRCLVLRTRFAWIAVLVDPVTAQPVKLLLGERIG